MRYREVLSLLVLASLMGAIPCTILAQAGTGTINGSLLNSDSTPNVNAKVSSLYYAGGTAVETVVYSDAAGNFSFSGMPVGTRVSVVAYDASKHVVGMGSAVIGSSGATVTVSIQTVPVVIQG